MSPRNLVLLVLGLTGAWSIRQQAQADEPRSQTVVVRVGGDERQYIVQPPRQSAESPPVVFVFHGHGGSAQRMVAKGFSQHWPDALFVYPQGLNTPTSRDPDGERSGWQSRSGLVDNRDLEFFDVMLKQLGERFNVNPNQVYATGHSNGGGMTALLWTQRRDKFAAVAISAGGVGEPRKLQPLPVFHLIGNADPIVKPANQRRNIALYKKVNQAESEATQVAEVGGRYPSKLGCDVYVFQHDGGHRFHPEAPQRIVSFFKTQRKPSEGYPKNDSFSIDRASASKGSWADRFGQLDRNGDGKLTQEEFRRAVLFQRLDRNADGVITLTEVEATLP